MEWKKGERLVAYQKCAEQVKNLPDWLQGTTDYFGESLDIRSVVLDFILHLARKDEQITIDELTKLNNYVKDIRLRTPTFLWEELV